MVDEIAQPTPTDQGPADAGAAAPPFGDGQHRDKPMLPPMRQRLLIAAAVVVGGLAWLTALPLLRAADGSRGLSVFTARGGPAAIGYAVAAGLPALVLAALAASSGHALAGPFTLTASLLILAAVGGPIDGWITRAQPPEAYRSLMIEAGLWFALLLLGCWMIQELRAVVRPRLPPLLVATPEPIETALGLPSARALAAGAITAALGFVLTCLIVQSSDTGQVVGGLLLAFTAAAAAAQFAVPQRNPVAVLMAPAVAASAAYAYVAYSYPSADRFLAAWYGRDVLGAARVLPIFYASAGVAGCVLGVALTQSATAGDHNLKGPAKEKALPHTGGLLALWLSRRSKRKAASAAHRTHGGREAV